MSCARIQDSPDVLRKVTVVGMAVGVGDEVLLDEAVVVEDSEHVFGGPDPDFFAQIGVRDGIGFALELDVVIGMDRRLFPDCHLEALNW